MKHRSDVWTQPGPAAPRSPGPVAGPRWGRKFFEASEASDRTAKWFMGQIGLRYAVSRTARKRALIPKLRRRERAVTSAMVLARFHRACLRLVKKVRPKSLLG